MLTLELMEKYGQSYGEWIVQPQYIIDAAAEKLKLERLIAAK